VIIPPNPGLVSALGLHTVDVVHDLTRACRFTGEPDGCDAAQRIYREFEERMRALLAREGAREADTSYVRQLDLRYVGQAHLITVDVRGSRMDREAFRQAVTEFHAAHEREYRYCREEWPVEAAVVRLQGRAKTREVGLRTFSGLGEPGGDVRLVAKQREVYFEHHGWCTTDVWWRPSLAADTVCPGPSIIEDKTATILIPPDVHAVVDQLGNIVIRLEEQNGIA
jgi:N-methylhydantoinase A